MFRIKTKHIIHKESTEEGFTLIELMVVVVIIAILVAISTPIYNSQVGNAEEAGLKSDLKNANLAMETSLTTNGGKYLSYLPSGYAVQSDNNQITLDTAHSNEQAYCLIGTNTKINKTLYYVSSLGKITTDFSACSTNLKQADGSYSVSFKQSKALASSDAGLKAVIYYQAGVGKPNPPLSDYFITQIKSNGYATVDTQQIPLYSSITWSMVADYDFIFIRGSYWPSDTSTDWLGQALSAGKKVLVDGNDTISSTFYIKTEKRMWGTTGGYSPTYASGLYPPFPYTFTSTAWDSTDDNWKCITAINSPAVSLATYNVDGTVCHTMFAVSTDTGRFLYMTYANENSNSVFDAAVTWLTS